MLLDLLGTGFVGVRCLPRLRLSRDTRFVVVEGRSTAAAAAAVVAVVADEHMPVHSPVASLY
jgi:hypothetical protein